METDWGAKGAQLTGAQVQAFIKEQLTDNANAAKTNASNIANLQSKVTDLTNRMADDKTKVLVWFRNQYGASQWGSADQCKNWTAALGWIAQGIWIERDGLPPLIVSLETTTCSWSSSVGVGDEIITMSESYGDYNGKSHTAAILKNTALFDSASNEYCATWCNKYSTTGKAAGKWWLPSVGELMTIRKHINAINACRAAIELPALSREFASSTENSTGSFLGVSLGNSGNGMVPTSCNKVNYPTKTLAVTTP